MVQDCTQVCNTVRTVKGRVGILLTVRSANSLLYTFIATLGLQSWYHGPMCGVVCTPSCMMHHAWCDHDGESRGMMVPSHSPCTSLLERTCRSRWSFQSRHIPTHYLSLHRSSNAHVAQTENGKPLTEYPASQARMHAHNALAAPQSCG